MRRRGQNAKHLPRCHEELGRPGRTKEDSQVQGSYSEGKWQVSLHTTKGRIIEIYGTDKDTAQGTQGRRKAETRQERNKKCSAAAGEHTPAEAISRSTRKGPDLPIRNQNFAWDQLVACQTLLLSTTRESSTELGPVNAQADPVTCDMLLVPIRYVQIDTSPRLPTSSIIILVHDIPSKW